MSNSGDRVERGELLGPDADPAWGTSPGSPTPGIFSFSVFAPNICSKQVVVKVQTQHNHKPYVSSLQPPAYQECREVVTLSEWTDRWFFWCWKPATFAIFVFKLKITKKTVNSSSIPGFTSTHRTSTLWQTSSQGERCESRSELQQHQKRS